MSSSRVSRLMTSLAHGRESRLRLALHFFAQHPVGLLRSQEVQVQPFGWVSETTLSPSINLISSSSDTPPAKRQEYVNQFNKSSQRSNCEHIPLLH